MARHKSIVVAQFPTIKFTNKLDIFLYTQLKKMQLQFSRNVRVDLIGSFNYNEEKIKPVWMVLHYLIRRENKIVAVLLLRAKHYGIHPNEIKVPWLKHNLKIKGIFPFILEVVDEKTATEALRSIYRNIYPPTNAQPINLTTKPQ